MDEKGRSMQARPLLNIPPVEREALASDIQGWGGRRSAVNSGLRNL
jgi:hypothetical protein